MPKRGRAELGKRNRAIIIAELSKNPMTFTQIKQKLGFSPKTLTQHLKTLESEGLVKREIRGRFVVYTVNKPKTVLELRKQFFYQLLDLKSIYDSVLNEKTRQLLEETLKALKESIKKPSEEDKTTKVATKIIKIPEKFRGTIKQSLTNIYEKPEFDKMEDKPSKPYAFKRKGRKRYEN